MMGELKNEVFQELRAKFSNSLDAKREGERERRGTKRKEMERITRTSQSEFTSPLRVMEK